MLPTYRGKCKRTSTWAYGGPNTMLTRHFPQVTYASLSSRAPQLGHKATIRMSRGRTNLFHSSGKFPLGDGVIWKLEQKHVKRAWCAYFFHPRPPLAWLPDNDGIVLQVPVLYREQMHKRPRLISLPFPAGQSPAEVTGIPISGHLCTR